MNSRTIASPPVSDVRRTHSYLWALGVTIVLAIVVIAGLSFWQGSVNGAVSAPLAAPLSGERFLAQNPELSVAARYAAANSAITDEAAFLAQNPELSVAARYAGVEDEATFLARNPELSAARRYAKLNNAH